MDTNWSLLIGRFHPLVVHLPIGILIFTIVVQIICRLKKASPNQSFLNLGLSIALVSAVLSVVTGLLLSQNGNYPPDQISLHKWLAISMSVLLLVVWLIKRYSSPAFQALANWLVVICVFLTALAGHAGGVLTHGEGYLTKFLPVGMKKVQDRDRKVEEKKRSLVLDSVIIYRDIVQPIFDRKCVGCHNPSNARGALVLNSMDSILKGGLSGAAVVPGDPMNSELFKRITLPSDRLKFMPTGNETPLTPVEIYFIKYWIEQGAGMGEAIGTKKIEPETKGAVSAYLGLSSTTSKEIRLPVASLGDSALIDQLRSAGILIRPISSGSNLLEVSFVALSKEPVEEINKLLKELTGLKGQVFDLSINNCHLDLESINNIATLNLLSKLDLRANQLSDQSIVPLKKLSSLHYLNLSANNLTDDCISTIREIKSLQKIYLGQNKDSALHFKDSKSIESAH